MSIPPATVLNMTYIRSALPLAHKAHVRTATVGIPCFERGPACKRPAPIPPRLLLPIHFSVWGNRAQRCRNAPCMHDPATLSDCTGLTCLSCSILDHTSCGHKSKDTHQRPAHRNNHAQMLCPAQVHSGWRSHHVAARATRALICGLWGNVCSARYFSINYPDFSPRFTLPWRSPPSRPHCTAHLPYKARCKIKQDL